MRGGRHDGLAYALVKPEGDAAGRVVVLHAPGSCKENHLGFAHACAASGLAAIAFDQRGHGASEGALGAGALDDVAVMAALLPGDGPLFLRGSSMGGFVAIAAAQLVGARAVVAICSAGPNLLIGALRHEQLSFAADRPTLERLRAATDLERAARAPGPDLMLLHAEGDDRVPIAHCERLHALAAGSRFVRVPGGDTSRRRPTPRCATMPCASCSSAAHSASATRPRAESENCFR